MRWSLRECLRQESCFTVLFFAELSLTVRSSKKHQITSQRLSLRGTTFSTTARLTVRAATVPEAATSATVRGRRRLLNLAKCASLFFSEKGAFADARCPSGRTLSLMKIAKKEFAAKKRRQRRGRRGRLPSPPLLLLRQGRAAKKRRSGGG